MTINVADGKGNRILGVGSTVLTAAPNDHR